MPNITIYLPHEIYEKLKQKGKYKGKSLYKLVQDAVKKELEKD